MKSNEEKGYRFVPILTGLFFIGIGISIFWVFGNNILTWILGGLPFIFGLSCLKIGLFGSQRLLDNMCLKKDSDDDAKKEWRQIQGLDKHE